MRRLRHHPRFPAGFLPRVHRTGRAAPPASRRIPRGISRHNSARSPELILIPSGTSSLPRDNTAMDSTAQNEDDESSRRATRTIKATMLRVTGVSKSFGVLRVLREVELEAVAGGITGIIGPNGAGKSTLLYVIGGLIKPDAGNVVLDGVDITSVVPHRRAL